MSTQPQVRLNLHPQASLTRENPSLLTVRFSLMRQQITSRDPATLDALQRLAGEALSEDELIRAANDNAPGVFYVLNQLHALGLLWYTLLDDTAPIATFRPISPRFAPRHWRLADDLRLSLSRFALCRRHTGQTVLDSPQATAQVAIMQPASLAPLWADTPLTADDYADRLSGHLGAATARALWGLLHHTGFLTIDQDGTSSEDADPIRHQWTFHDALFHQMSRLGQYQFLLNQPRSFPAHISPQPATPPRRGTQLIPLPDVNSAAPDPPFAEVIAARHTTREFNDAAPIDLAALGEWLHRAARATRDTQPATPERPYEIGGRSYGGAGACYELELYLTVRLCAGLPPGAYHYRAADHSLDVLPAPADPLQRLFEAARAALRVPSLPHIHLTIAARFGRVNWKYDPIAYALILKDAGVLLHHLWLAATVMRLGFAPLGSGHTETCAALLPDPLAEGPVAEAVLGSLPPS